MQRAAANSSARAHTRAPAAPANAVCRCAVLQPVLLLRCRARCTALQSLHQVPKGCGLLQPMARRSNRLRCCFAKGTHVAALRCNRCNRLQSLQQVEMRKRFVATDALRCNSLRRVATDCATVLWHTLRCSHRVPCAALRSLQSVAIVCVRCNGRYWIATGCAALPPVELLCCGPRVAKRCAALQQVVLWHTLCCHHVVCAALQSPLQAAAGCGLLQRAVSVATDCTASQPVVARCTRFRLRRGRIQGVATNCAVATRCNKWSADVF